MCPRFEFFTPGRGVDHRRQFCVLCGAASGAVQRGDSDEDDHLHFSGLPSPGAAGAIAGFAIMFYTLRGKADLPQPPYAEQIDRVLQTILPFFGRPGGAVDGLADPAIRTSPTSLFRGQRSFGHVVAVIFALVVVCGHPRLRGADRVLRLRLGEPDPLAWEKIVQRRHQEEPVF